MKIKQRHISDAIGVKQPMVSMLLSGKRPVSWPLAEKLSELFPEKTIQQWKGATPVELEQAFEQLDEVVA